MKEHGHVNDLQHDALDKGATATRFSYLQPPRPATGVSPALRARSVPRVSRRVSPKAGVSEGVSDRVSPGTLSTLWTLRSQGPKGPRGHPVGHSLGQTRFRGHSRGHSRDTSGPKGPRDSCSRSGGGCNLIHLLCVLSPALLSKKSSCVFVFPSSSRVLGGQQYRSS